MCASHAQDLFYKRVQSGSSVARALPIRVGILMDHPSPHMVPLLDALAQRDDCVAEVIYFGYIAPGRNWGSPAGLLSHSFLSGFPWPRKQRFSPAIFAALERRQVDIWIVNTCYTTPNTIAAAWWLSRKGLPWVYMNEPSRPRSGLMSMVKSWPLDFVLSKTRGVIGMGRQPLSIYQQLVGDSRPCASVPYYVDLTDFFFLPRIEGPRPGDPIRFVTSGQMVHRKGIDVLLEACKALQSPNWQLSLFGDGPLRKKLEQQSSRTFPPGKVVFKGHVPFEKRHEAFSKQHIFVFPSRWDGWGMVLPEAMAAGLPVITTDQVMSAHEFVRRGVNGFLIPSDDPPSLADHMMFFMSHPENIAPMGAAARASLSSYKAETGAELLVRFLTDLVRHEKLRSAHSSKPSLGQSVRWSDLAPQQPDGRVDFTEIRRSARRLAIRTSNLLNRSFRPAGHRILVYHLVLKEDAGTFEEHIRFLKDHYILSTVSDLLSMAYSAAERQHPHVAVTFDDGFRVLTQDCLQVLERCGVRATFFIPTGFIHLREEPQLAGWYSLRAHYYFRNPIEPMTTDDLRQLIRMGHEVGSHGISHISMQAMSNYQAARELDLSRLQLAEWTGVVPIGFAYPYGHTGNRLEQPERLVAESGYAYGVTLQRGKVTAQSDRFLLPREHTEGNWPLADLKFFLSR